MTGSWKTAEILNSSEVVFTIVYDNNSYQSGLQTDWGFSCHLQLPDSAILFDTGGRGQLLLENMRHLGLDPSRIDTVFLSHSHTDHTGGLPALIDVNSNLNVCLPKTFPASFKDLLREKAVHITETEGFVAIGSGVYSTGDLGGWLAEQSLIVDTEAGAVVITGCAHPGIVDTLKKVREIIDKDILLAMGGFHLEGESQSELETFLSLFKILGVKYVAPCHCTGDLARKIFRIGYGENYIESGVGRRIHFGAEESGQ
jgi:7,8-dihydropterin-6-yl-methyl-4-(beta-D-ribofuranosyl)aminobenzene 5'-phosphate synthase